jgi:hypothetical protein
LYRHRLVDRVGSQFHEASRCALGASRQRRAAQYVVAIDGLLTTVIGPPSVDVSFSGSSGASKGRLTLFPDAWDFRELRVAGLCKP